MDQIGETTAAELFRMVVGPLDNNVYLIRSKSTREAVVIDAAAEPAMLSEHLQPYDPSLILTTHGHGDHVGAVHVLRSRGMPFALHPADGFMVGEPIDRPHDDGESIEVGNVIVDVIHTPGHTPGSVCFHVEGVLFTGDTLFPGGPGATRFSYSDFDQIIDSVRTRLLVFDDATVFHPGHGQPSTIGHEAPALDEWIERGW